MAWSTERSPSGTTLNETSTGQLSPSFRRTYAPSGQRVVPSTVPADTGTSASLVLADATKVNSIHHQAVLDPGDLRATAWSDDGVIEAIEADGALGVQWHPERLLDADARHLAPFQWLVEGA